MTWPWMPPKWWEKRTCYQVFWFQRNPKHNKPGGKISFVSRFAKQISTRSQVCSASLHTSLCVLSTTAIKASGNATESSPHNILFLQRISLIKNRKELPKQGNFDAFFKHFFKRIIITVLASTNIACSFSSPSPARLVSVHSVPGEEFFFLIFLFHTSYSSQ